MGSLAWEGEGLAPRLPLAADRDGVLWLLFCVLVACGVGGDFVAFSLVADSVCELCVVIAGWRSASAVWDDLIEFAAEWVWCFECEVYGFAAQWADWYWSFGCDVSGFAFAAGCSVLVSARTCLVAHVPHPVWWLVAWAGFEFAVARPLWVYCGHALAVAAVAGYGLYRTQAVAYAVGFDPATCGFGDRCSTC